MDCEVCGDPDVDGHEHEAVVVREGASLRTADELNVVLLDDVADLTKSKEIALLAQSWSEVLGQYRDSHTGLAHLPEDNENHSSEDLSDDARRAEDVLNEMGYLIVHDDGYVIYRARPPLAQVTGN